MGDSEMGEFKTMTLDEEGRLVTEDGTILPPDTTVYIPTDGVPVKFVPAPTTQRRGEEGGITTFSGLREKVFDDPVSANPYDCLMRNTLRLLFWNAIHQFAALDSLLPKTFVFLQLVLVDENRQIQEKMYQGLSRQKPADPSVTENSRQKFRELITHLLQDTNLWVLSRSLMIKEYNKDLLNKTLFKFLSRDPVGGLKDVTCDILFGTPDSEVSKMFNGLREKAVREYKDKDVPHGVRCAEVFMFIAGDFALDDGGLNSREAVQELLCHLTTEGGIQKLYGFDEMTGSCPKVSPEKIAALKDVHLTA